MGYPRVEKLVETEDFAEINEAFEGAYAGLAEIAGKKRGLKKSREAKKVMKAMELVMDLFRDLLAIKYQLQEMYEEQQKNQ